MQENTEVAQTEVRAWARSIGITGPSTTVVGIRTDAEQSLVNFLESSLVGRIEKSAPQTPESTGGAERAVRVLKENLACISQDLLDDGFQLLVNRESIPYIVRYIAVMHNQHHKVFGGNRTPSQHVVGQDRQPFKSSMLGAVVFAEVPDSVQSPSGSRFIPAAFLGYEFASRAPLVSGKVGQPGETSVKVFRAKSIKVLSKIVYAVDFCPFLLKINEEGQGRRSDFDPTVDSGTGFKERAPLSMPKSGPPKAWLDRFGRTENCYACKQSALHGRVHSARCKRRYETWLREQRQQEENQPGFEPAPRPEGSSAPSVASHPTGYRRASQKQPPVAPAGMGADSSERFEPESPPIPDGPPLDPDNDVDMNDYSPSMAPANDPDDPMEIDLATSFRFVRDEPIEMQTACVFTGETTQELLKLGASSLADHTHANFISPMYLPKIGMPTRYSKFRLGGRDVFLARPEQVFTEDRKVTLDVDKTVLAREVELGSMEKVSFGTILDKKEADAFCKKYDVKPISCRWVVTEKEINNLPDVRCRMVVQQVATGNGVASTLGYSSNTPSGEAVRSILILAASNGWRIGTLDVSTAFMNSDLPPGMKVIVRMPGDVSLSQDHHEPAFAVLKRALNGLRCASKAWLMLAKSICESHGLSACPGEPCVFRGKFRKNSFFCNMALVIYVDDILVSFDREGALEHLREAFQEKVQKVKLCGQIGIKEEGKVTFLGREIARRKGSDSLFIRVPPSYLEEVTENMTAKEIPPQLDLQKQTSEADNKPLTAEAASMYRTILGKVAWWAQTRVDVLRYISILSTGQSTPLHKHEIGLKKLLRFLKSSLHLWQEFKIDNKSGIQLYCDASWKDISVSGYLLHNVEGKLVEGS